MTLVYRTAGAWGAGKGSNLTAAEVDANFYALDQRITALENNPPSAIAISNVTVVGSLMTIHMQDGSTFGPFTLPRAFYNWRGEWAATTQYFLNDTFFVADQGIFMVLDDHTSDTDFDPTASDTSGNLYQQMFEAIDAPYDISFQIEDLSGSGEVVGRIAMSRDIQIPAGATGSVAIAAVAATASTVYTLKKNGSSFGTITFAISGTAGTFSVASFENFTSADVLTVEAPSPADATLADIAITLAATRL